MSRSGGAMHVLYVDPDGLVRSGRLVTDPQRRADSGPVLMSRAGQPLRPTDVLALLVSRPVSEDRCASLAQAAELGYRVEET